MLKFLKRNREEKITVPCQGLLIPLEEVKDAIFSQRLLGDGFAVIPAGDVISAPCSGRITMIAHTAHAFGITTDNGAEILVHIGLDTVNLNGKGFKVLECVNHKVKAGTPILKLDTAFMKEQNIDLTIPIILVNGTDFCMEMLKLRGELQCGEEVASITKG